MKHFRGGRISCGLRFRQDLNLDRNLDKTHSGDNREYQIIEDTGMHSEYTLSAPKPCPFPIEELTSVSNYQTTGSKTCTFE